MAGTACGGHLDRRKIYDKGNNRVLSPMLLLLVSCVIQGQNRCGVARMSIITRMLKLDFLESLNAALVSFSFNLQLDDRPPSDSHLKQLNQQHNALRRQIKSLMAALSKGSGVCKTSLCVLRKRQAGDQRPQPAEEGPECLGVE